jgi:hypothetical protein
VKEVAQQSCAGAVRLGLSSWRHGRGQMTEHVPESTYCAALTRIKLAIVQSELIATGRDTKSVCYRTSAHRRDVQNKTTCIKEQHQTCDVYSEGFKGECCELCYIVDAV